MFKKADIYLIFMIAAICFAGIFSFAPKTGERISVTVDGKEFCQASLSVDKTIELPHGTLVIENGQVRMTDSDCPDQICVRQGGISAGSLICLPNRVVVRVIGGEYDAVVGR